ncbi:alpha/beta fold hydrolase [Candidatus Daviesbacteria bacterium]|nr:alpha/beta fold hydrolase [Candidatus Daviesbacteria bacterium]MBI4035361.1 alpha/beta fold hydrolase [Candidatus Daviesbacteria bacterium]
MRIILPFFLITIFVLTGLFLYSKKETNLESPTTNNLVNNIGDEFVVSNNLHPLTIESLRNGEYPGSDLVIEETLENGSNYSRYIAAYLSEGLKIYGLLTVPNGDMPKNGWPAIIFNHGYIPPTQYRTAEKYVAYMNGFARNGYVLFKSDYRGHGDSEGEPQGAYGSNAYTVDVLNAVASVKKYKDVDPQRIGMWGHSLGGFLTLRSMVVSKDIKAGVIWAGVVGSYPDLLNNWRRRSASPPPGIPSGARRWREVLVEQYGTPEQNPFFWNSISANSYLSDISGSVQLHHGTADSSVPYEFSQKLEEQLKEAEKEVELYIYPGNDHNLSQSFGLAVQRSVEFFDKYLKE